MLDQLARMLFDIEHRCKDGISLIMLKNLDVRVEDERINPAAGEIVTVRERVKRWRSLWHTLNGYPIPVGIRSEAIRINERQTVDRVVDFALLNRVHFNVQPDRVITQLWLVNDDA